MDSIRIAPGTAVRRVEWVLTAFLSYAVAVTMILPVAPALRSRVLLLNLAVILIYSAIARLDSLKPRLALSVVRDWMPLALILLAYREMGWLALPHPGHALEAHWVVWDRAILRGGAKTLIEAFGPVLPSLLEIAYALVYALAPFSLAMLYVYGRRDQAGRFLFIFAVGVLLSYAQFPLWPSDPPRVVFAGQDFPLYDTIFRRFNLWMLGNYGIHTSVFPSAHVAAAFSAAFGISRVTPRPRWLTRFLYSMAALIAVATVYGRYHYSADAAAGFLMAVFAVALESVRWERLYQGVGLRLPAGSPNPASALPRTAANSRGLA